MKNANATPKPATVKASGNGNGKTKISPRDEQRITFAQKWNDEQYKTPYDLEVALKATWHSIQARARRYKKYREDHPELQDVLPVLLWRKSSPGGHIILDEEHMAMLEPWRKDLSDLKKASGIVVTAAQRGAMINTHFWNSLKSYCKYRNFVLIVLPIQYGRYKKETLFADELKGYIAFDDIPLQKDTLNLSTMRLRPTLQKFLTDAICEMGGTTTQIIAAPRHELVHRPRMGHHYPKAIMTTGAVTHPNYKVDKLGQQDRTGEVATANHAFGAILVEFQGSDVFHYRQLNAGNRGSFHDIAPFHGGSMFFDGEHITHEPDAVTGVVCGDVHVRKTDKLVKKVTFDGKSSIIGSLSPDHVILHDLSDIESISHWDSKSVSRRIHKVKTGRDNLRDELNENVDFLKWLLNKFDGALHIIPSNHNEFVKRWIEGEEFMHDDTNKEIGMELLLMINKELEERDPDSHEVRSVDPVNLYIKTAFAGLDEAERVRTLERQDKLLLPELSRREEKKQISLSMHGDIGPLGGRMSGMASLRKMNQRTIIGHNHSAAIEGPIWRVGTMTPRQEHYMNTPMTNWTNTHAVIFENGQRMLINIVKGKWHGYKQTEAKLKN